MLPAVVGIVAALAFVLGLGALVVWVLKRFSNFGLTPRSRIPVEVVQRVSLGPRTGLAVVRVGAKVMAVSVGDGGVRPLFELEEEDRQQVLAGSKVALSMTSSEAATAAFANPGLKKSAALAALSALTGRRGRAASRELQAFAKTTVASAAATPAVVRAEPSTPERMDDFRSMLRMSLHPTTKLAGMLLIAILTLAVPGTDAHAQASRSNAVQSAATTSGNGASASATSPNGARAMSNLVAPDPSADPTQLRAAAAPAATVAGGAEALAQMIPQMDIKLGNEADGGLRLNGTVGIVVMMGLLTLLPTLLLMMTGFTRILIVLHFVKQAMGTQGAPPAHLLAGLALLLTGFVMAPTFTQMNREAITPWMNGQMTQVEMMKEGVRPMREFMLKQTRPADLKTFVDLSQMERPDTADDVPLHVLMSAFVVSELRTAFQIGFAIYLPFIVIDAVVASVLMSMGMFMLPPAMISLPFKLLLFVLVDGWNLLITSLIHSFR